MAIQATVSARSAYRQLLRATRLAFKGAPERTQKYPG